MALSSSDRVSTRQNSAKAQSASLPLTEATAHELIATMNRLIDVLAKFSVAQASSIVAPAMPAGPAPGICMPPLDALATALCRSMQIEGEEMRRKATRAVVVGMPEKTKPEDTARADEETVRQLVDWTESEELKKMWKDGSIEHKRHPPNAPRRRRIMKLAFPSSDCRDLFLAAIRRTGRPPCLADHTGSYVRRDLARTELQLEKEAKHEARRRNTEEGSLRWGVRDEKLREFRGPWRALPPNYAPVAPVVSSSQTAAPVPAIADDSMPSLAPA